VRDDSASPRSLPPAEAVLKFLASVGPGSEAELYLRLFRSRPAERFAVLAIEHDAIEQHGEQVAVDVRFLGELGLYPTLALGLDGGDARASEKLFSTLTRAGVACEHVRERARREVDPVAAITAATARGVVPLWTIPGATRHERLRALGQTLAQLSSDKLVFLRPEGGIWLRGSRLSVVNMQVDYDALVLEPALDGATRSLLADVQRLLLEHVPHRLLVALTSPLDLLHELFTVKGAGTLLRKGAIIERHDGYEGVDMSRLTLLLESSFGKPLSPSFSKRPVQHAYVEELYRGAALVMKTELGGYLSKFAVTREAQGEGIGHDLWTALTADYAALFWRARSENPIRTWYERQCQGRYQAGIWTVYFRGLKPADVPLAIERALAEPLDF
jgi:hypothetical protein